MKFPDARYAFDHDGFSPEGAQPLDQVIDDLVNDLLLEARLINDEGLMPKPWHFGYFPAIAPASPALDLTLELKAGGCDRNSTAQFQSDLAPLSRLLAQRAASRARSQRGSMTRGCALASVLISSLIASTLWYLDLKGPRLGAPPFSSVQHEAPR
jgi:hypothetical protein